MKLLLGVLAAHFICASLLAGDLASKVNPLVGTGISTQNDYGKVHPGASMPFGMLYWSPDQLQGDFYNYAEPRIRGFGLTHISGPGCPTLGDVPIFPLLGAARTPEGQFEHTNETAEPGYYSVLLDSGIRVELAASLRAGMAQISFPERAGQRTLLIDAAHNLTRVDRANLHLEGNRIVGSVTSGHFCGLENVYTVYFAIEVEQTPATHGTFGATATGSGEWLGYPVSLRTLRLRAAVSYVSIHNAEQNLTEIEDWSFGRVRMRARASWNEVLGSVQVEGGSAEQQRVFYTALYHSFLHPSTFSDGNGEYMGFDGQVHRRGGSAQYTNISGWDVYRSQVQLLAMLFPDRASDVAQSLIADAEQSGGLPRWPIANDDCGCMVGDPSDLIIASVYAFGARAFDSRSALRVMLRAANDPAVTVHRQAARPQLDEYLRSGYVAAIGKRYGPASISLEYYSADFAISQFAKAIGDVADAKTFLLRSAKWRKLFDVQTKYIRPRDGQGRFLVPFDPGAETGFVEGNAAQYSWMIPYDLRGLVEAMGGSANVNHRLDKYFQSYSASHRERFNIGNEPSFPNPWIYLWTGKPWRTQAVVRETLTELFHDAPGGLPGNDDLGATSSWVVLSSLGIYPAIPGVGGVALSTPLFPRATLRMDQHTLTIRADGVPERQYLKGARLDGRAVRGNWIWSTDLLRASELRFLTSDTVRQTDSATPPSFAP